MRLKIIFLLFLMMFLTCATGLTAENTGLVPGVGTLTLPAEVELTPYNGKLGVLYSLLVDDNGTWRAARFSFLPPLTGENINDLNDRTTPLKKTIMEIMYRMLENPDSRRLLQTTPFNSLALTDEKTIFRSFKILHYNLYARQTNFYLINRSDGIRILILECEDSDREYWTPIITKVIENIKS